MLRHDEPAAPRGHTAAGQRAEAAHAVFLPYAACLQSVRFRTRRCERKKAVLRIQVQVCRGGRA
jgi:hypothetical protein